MVTGVDNPAMVPVPDLPLPVPPETLPAEKPGWQTTEFWLTLIALVVGALMSSGAVQEGTTLYQALAFAAVILTTLGYTVSRTIAKKAVADNNGKAQVAYHQSVQAYRVERVRKITLE